MNIYLRCTLVLAASLAVWLTTLIGNMPTLHIVPVASASSANFQPDASILPPTTAAYPTQQVALRCAPNCSAQVAAVRASN